VFWGRGGGAICFCLLQQSSCIKRFLDVQILFEIPDPLEFYGYVLEMIINRAWGKTFDYVSFLDFQVLFTKIDGWAEFACQMLECPCR